MRKTRVSLTPAQRQEVVTRFAKGEKAVALATEYNVTRQSIYRIVRDAIKSQKPAGSV